MKRPCPFVAVKGYVKGYVKGFAKDIHTAESRGASVCGCASLDAVALHSGCLALHSASVGAKALHSEHPAMASGHFLGVHFEAMAAPEDAAPRGTASWRLPRHVADAFVLLRIERDVEFIASFDGRSRKPSAELWEGIAEELRSTFSDIAGIEKVNGRFLVKKWSFIEKEVKVRGQGMSSFGLRVTRHHRNTLTGRSRVERSSRRLQLAWPPLACWRPSFSISSFAGLT